MARKLILIIFALLIAGTTVWFVRNWAGSQTTQVAEGPKVEAAKIEPAKPKAKVLVAASDLPAGTLVREQHLKWLPWPEGDGLEDTYVVESKRPVEEFYGTVVRQGIAMGEPVTDGRLVKPGQSGFLAAVLSPGTRAISIQIDATSGIAGFVFPGDRVDVILTHNVTNNADENSKPRFASETIMRDVRVVAMDQSTNDQDQEASIRGVATLEVSPKAVEIISVVREVGRLSLSLRSITEVSGDTGEGKLAEGRGYTWDSDASKVITAPGRGGGKAKTVNVVRAGTVAQEAFK